MNMKKYLIKYSVSFFYEEPKNDIIEYGETIVTYPSTMSINDAANSWSADFADTDESDLVEIPDDFDYTESSLDIINISEIKS